MFELIYRSVAITGINANDITDILKVSRNFNGVHQITGCLVYHNNEFIQILEGDKKIVQELYAKIEKDKRHTAVTLLDENEKAARIFPNWSMAYYDNSSPDIDEADQLLFKTNFLATASLTEKPTHAVNLFWHIAKQLLEK
jgi:hypothetical protein